MKKIILVLLLLFSLTMSACDFTEDEGLLDYSDLSHVSLNSYAEAEGMSNDKYIIYYYSETCPPCQTAKQDILGFAVDFELIDFYLVDINNVSDTSSYDELEGTPTVLVISGETVIESYKGLDEVLDFISIYSEIQFDYGLFDLQQLNTYNGILEITSERYLVYYYLETCPNCIEIKNTVLTWGFTKNVNELFIMNGASVIDPDNIPTELQILASGTPILIVMNNGVFTNEYYSGKDSILDYIETDTDID